MRLLQQMVLRANRLLNNGANPKTLSQKRHDLSRLGSLHAHTVKGLGFTERHATACTAVSLDNPVTVFETAKTLGWTRTALTCQLDLSRPNNVEYACI